MQDKINFYIELTGKYIKMYSALESAILGGKNVAKDMFDLYYATCHASKQFMMCIYALYLEEIGGESDNFDIILTYLKRTPEYEKIADAYVSLICLEERIEKFIGYMGKCDVAVGVTDVELKK